MKTWYLLLLLVIFAAGCGSGSDSSNLIDPDKTGNPSDSSDLNNFVSNTLFDSLPVEKLPYIDSIGLASFKPLRRIKLDQKDIAFLQLKELRALRQFDRPMDDSLFTAVCRLKCSPQYYTVIINYNGENETINYLINYDRQFRVIDYMECSYDEIVESALRMSSKIDTGGITVYYADFLRDPEYASNFRYHVSPDGFFRENIAAK